MMLLRHDFILSAIQEDASLYDIFSSEIGRQFFKNCLGLSPLGNSVRIPYLCVVDRVPCSYAKFIERNKNHDKSLKKTL